MSGFWSGWIILITLGNIFACYWLVRWTTKKRPGEAASGDVTGHRWDGLEEYNNPLPRWWLWLFYITIVFSLAYLVLFPGLGTFKGVLNWGSQDSQYQGEMQQAGETFDPIFKKYAAMPIEQVAKDADAQGMGRRLFLNYCAQCHGSDAGGAAGFPNLADNDWLYGGTPDQIKQTILLGRQGAMPAHKDRVDAAGVEALAHYVMSLSGRKEADAAKVSQGQQLFTANACMACHGMDGKGNQAMGAPNLTDNTWLYGSSLDTIKETITNGRNGKMPAHADFLGEDKVHLLAAYVYGLSQKP
ncbi:MAG: cytochrome-c oxidase, cbb3-type subunit [Pseudomonadota bacterium]|jgi:cytochrome c oxidase cbb3-type subunit 3|uniref:Cbb3-type cytochrome c oxidase subunit n=1 Tax=Thiothrix fructosivorans TaxID=111770 RepID=A0A8B0SFR1_9GAMM|nr:cytochrome-c oxidase, cbb3-type subunit III [Thiothrix fructosivorans]MBO0614809.1 cytochrome-c oxidase, cbb3-type subunit III [Thiothrix fructosivorans]QTX09625.1 cytochrome-c oxidase, cbb3-type subunit III [Thiothrix fructosivorans]